MKTRNCRDNFSEAYCVSAKMPVIKGVEGLMRGLQDGQTSMLAIISIEQRIPSEHPLRRIKGMARSRA